MTGQGRSGRRGRRKLGTAKFQQLYWERLPPEAPGRIPAKRGSDGTQEPQRKVPQFRK
ncbi:hypothetical protein [Sphingobacterium sp.]|uniref:hypothetical protein n=1 Tax=Sphingobacterium sp. TaxID=341027 RepID=UPI0028969A61|nr:hypothetical protein [Sphingobacterium sp.]